MRRLGVLFSATVISAMGFAAGPPNRVSHNSHHTAQGSYNSEVIPDAVAYRLLFRLLAVAQNTDLERRRVRAFAKDTGLNELQIEELLAVAETYRRQSAFDSHATLQQLVTSLPSRLGVDGAQTLQQHIKDRVKPKVKVVSAQPNLPPR